MDPRSQTKLDCWRHWANGCWSRCCGIWELPEPIWIAVNLAGSQLNPSVVQSLLSLLDDSGVDPTRLVVEVREKSLTRSPTRRWRGIVDLTEAGIRVFFDDFGSGPSSLTTLGRLPVAGIKLDKSFTDTIDDASGPGGGSPRRCLNWRCPSGWRR